MENLISTESAQKNLILDIQSKKRKSKIINIIQIPQNLNKSLKYYNKYIKKQNNSDDLKHLKNEVEQMTQLNLKLQKQLMKEKINQSYKNQLQKSIDFMQENQAEKKQKNYIGYLNELIIIEKKNQQLREDITKIKKRNRSWTVNKKNDSKKQKNDHNFSIFQFTKKIKDFVDDEAQIPSGCINSQTYTCQNSLKKLIKVKNKEYKTQLEDNKEQKNCKLDFLIQKRFSKQNNLINDCQTNDDKKFQYLKKNQNKKSKSQIQKKNRKISTQFQKKLINKIDQDLLKTNSKKNKRGSYILNKKSNKKKIENKIERTVLKKINSKVIDNSIEDVDNIVTNKGRKKQKRQSILSQVNKEKKIKDKIIKKEKERKQIIDKILKKEKQNQSNLGKIQKKSSVKNLIKIDNQQHEQQQNINDKKQEKKEERNQKPKINDIHINTNIQIDELQQSIEQEVQKTESLSENLQLEKTFKETDSKGKSKQNSRSTITIIKDEKIHSEMFQEMNEEYMSEISQSSEQESFEKHIENQINNNKFQARYTFGFGKLEINSQKKVYVNQFPVIESIKEQSNSEFGKEKSLSNIEQKDSLIFTNPIALKKYQELVTKKIQYQYHELQIRLKEQYLQDRQRRF